MTAERVPLFIHDTIHNEVHEVIRRAVNDEPGGLPMYRCAWTEGLGFCVLSAGEPGYVEIWTEAEFAALRLLGAKVFWMDEEDQGQDS